MDTSVDSTTVIQPLFQVGEGGSIPTSTHQLKLVQVSKKVAELAYRKWHYLGKQGLMGTMHYGVYFENELVGCITFGCMSAHSMAGLYEKNTQKGFWEIKRLALRDDMPKNSESRVISVGIRLLKKAQYVKTIITYADSEQGHTGTIYKASGFTYKGLTAQKTDLFIDGKKVGKKGQYRRATNGEKEEWRPRSRKHLFIYQLT